LADEVAVGLANHGTSHVEDFVVKEAGVGVQALSGSLTLHGISVENASVGIATVSGASSTVSQFNGHGMPLAIDAGDADDFSVSSGILYGERFMVGQGTSLMHISDVDFFSTSADEMRPAVDVRCEGQCTLEHTDIHSPTVGISWSGSGTSFMDNVSVYAVEQAVETSGSGHAVWTNLTVNASNTGLSVQTPTSALTDVYVELTDNQAIGIDLLGGQHDWSDVVVEKAFTSTDQTSIGLNAWYSDLTLDQFTSRNVSTGMLLEDSTAVVQSVEANIGSLAGLHLIDSSLSGNDLTTIAQDRGVLMEGSASLHLSSWTAQLHETPLMLSTESTATVRSFTPLNTAQSSADALGDGTLYYGSSSNPTISTSTAYRLLETDVTFTDLAGQPVDYTIAQLTKYRESVRKTDESFGGMMRGVAETLTDSEIAILADYIRGLH